MTTLDLADLAHTPAGAPFTLDDGRTAVRLPCTNDRLADLARTILGTHDVTLIAHHDNDWLVYAAPKTRCTASDTLGG